MGKRIGRILILTVLAVAILLPGTGAVRAAERLSQVNLALTVDDREPVNVKAFQLSYPNNLLLSMRDLAVALEDTPKAFSLSLSDDETYDYQVDISREIPYERIGGENSAFSQLDATDGIFGSLQSYRFFLDAQEMRLPAYVSDQDVFLPIAYVGMYLDIPLEFTDSGALSVHSEQAYRFDLTGQEECGYFHFLHSALLADAQTGCILYAHNSREAVPIASTTKLFTYLLVKEAMDRGQFQEDSLYTVSDAVYREANAEDGLYGKGSRYGCLELGQQVCVGDLLRAMLMRSSNEAATALAEMVSGSEAEFVAQMNDRAAELGLSSAVFYNPHGLPSYDCTATPGKRQNEMCAQDMFALAQYLLQNHREHLTSITMCKRAELHSFGNTKDGKTAYARNTNALLYNLPGCLGLKTGTTNQAGTNLVCALPVTDSLGRTHDVVAIIFGAENDVERFEKSAWLLKYAQQYYGAHPFPQPEPPAVETEPVTEEPSTAEDIRVDAQAQPATAALYFLAGAVTAGALAGICALGKRARSHKKEE